MNWRPDASMDMLRVRARCLQQVRAFFEDRQVLEVETPILSAASVPDPYIESLQTNVYQQPQYLQTSPELYMKRLLAAGSGPIYQIARVFRDAECGRLHNPEFTLIEWYRPGFTQQQLMREVLDLVIHLCDLDEQDAQLQTTSYGALFQQTTGVNPLQEDWQAFNAFCQSNQLQCPIAGDDWSAAMDWVLSTVIQPGMQGLLFVYDYPATQASLARLDEHDPTIAKRFELFIDGIEMANGFEELTDAGQQRQRFEQENAVRRSRGLTAVSLDDLFLAALQAGLPETSGVALGLDRLLMWKTGSDKVQDVMSFAPVGMNTA